MNKHTSVADVYGRRLMERLAIVLLVGGCAKQMQSVDLRPQALDARDIAQIWSRGQVSRWTSVVITTDSVTGRTFPPMRGHRVGLPLAAVDSVRFCANCPTTGAQTVVAIVTIFALFTAVYFASTGT